MVELGDVSHDGALIWLGGIDDIRNVEKGRQAKLLLSNVERELQVLGGVGLVEAVVVDEVRTVGVNERAKGEAIFLHARISSVSQGQGQARQKGRTRTLPRGVEVLDGDTVISLCLLLTPQQEGILGSKLLFRNVIDGETANDHPNETD